MLVKLLYYFKKWNVFGLFLGFFVYLFVCFCSKIRNSLFNGPRNKKDYCTDFIYIGNLFINYLKDKLGKEIEMLKVKE